jgi:CspA family cold shock protein
LHNRRPRPERIDHRSDQAAVEETRTVKFYAAEKRFGFIVRDGGGGKDIFVGASALSRAGIGDLAEGQRVAVDMVEGSNGPEAVSLRLI